MENSIGPFKDLPLLAREEHRHLSCSGRRQLRHVSEALDERCTLDVMRHPF